MRHKQRNPVVYHTVCGMCEILEKKEKAQRKAIALNVGIDGSTFSKLLSGKRCINENHKAKIYEYMRREAFAEYAPLLIQYICRSLHIRESEALYKRMISKNYDELLHYLLYELEWREMAADEPGEDELLRRLYQNLKELFSLHPQETNGCQIITDERLQSFIRREGLEAYQLILIGNTDVFSALDNPCYLICSSEWHHESLLYADPQFQGCFDSCVTIRVREILQDHYCLIDHGENYRNIITELEMTRIDGVSRDLRDLADRIFAAVCQSEVPAS